MNFKENEPILSFSLTMVKNENLPLFRLPQLRRIVSRHFLTSGIVYPLTVEAADADISICFFLQKNVPKGRTERAQVWRLRQGVGKELG